MRPTKGWLGALTWLAASACGGTRGASSVDAASAKTDGIFDFVANVPGQQMGSTIRVRGTLAIVGDSLVVHPDTNCAIFTPEMNARLVASQRASIGPGVASLYCQGGARLTFYRHNPSAARWSATVRVPKQRNACVEYVRRETRQVCARYRPETYYEQQIRSGGIQVRLIS